MRDISNKDVPCLIYRFKSSFSHQWYIVRVEQYPQHFYGIKFYLKADRLSPLKYNRLTGLNEPRPVIFTCIAILLDIYHTDKIASFGFIGANITNEDIKETKRFRVYRRILTTYFSDKEFEHFQIIEKSAYAMVRKNALSQYPMLIEQLNKYFTENYSNFD